MDNKFDLYNWSENVIGTTTSEHLKYNGITSIVSEETIWNVRDRMENDPEVRELRKNILKNLKTYFDKRHEPAFMDYDYDIVRGPIYNEKYYEEYQNLLKNYDTMYLELNNERNAIKSKLGFGKKKKLAEIDKKIENLNEKYEKCVEIRNREESFENTWIKDGKFVDLNKDYEARYKEIRKAYIKEGIINLFEKHPDFMQYSFSSIQIDPVIRDLISEYQYARENNLEPFKDIKISNKNEFGNGDDGAPNSGLERERENDDDGPHIPPVNPPKIPVTANPNEKEKKEKKSEPEIEREM